MWYAAITLSGGGVILKPWRPRVQVEEYEMKAAEAARGRAAAALTEQVTQLWYIRKLHVMISSTMSELTYFQFGNLGIAM